MTMRQFCCRWLAGPVLALGLLGAGVAVLSLHAQTPGTAPPSTTAMPAPASLPVTEASGAVQRSGGMLRLSRDVPGDAKPILIDADAIHTWNEDGQVVLWLHGQVLVQQSVSKTRFQEGIAWIDLKRYRSTGVLHVEVYAEGQVRIENGLDAQEGSRALLDLNTRGEFRVRAHHGKVIRQDRSREALVGRARSLGLGPSALRQGPVKPPPAAVPAKTLPPVPGQGGIKRTSFEVPGSKKEVAPANTFQKPASTVPGGNPPASDYRPNKLPAPQAQGAPTLPVQRPDPDPVPGSDPGPPIPSRPDPEPLPRPAPTPPSGEPPAPIPPAPLPPPSQPAGPPRPSIPPKEAAPAPGVRPLVYRLAPRSGRAPNVKTQDEKDGRKIITVTGGLIMTVQNVPRIGTLDVEADRAVIWTTQGKAEGMANNLTSDTGETRDLEFYMAGHVVLRMQKPGSKERSAINADEMYYDAKKRVAVALNSQLEITSERFVGRLPGSNQQPLIISSKELLQTDETHYEVVKAEIFSSRLSSDPGLKLYVAKATVEERSRLATNILGRPVINPKTKQQLVINESIVRANNVVAELGGVPYFYTPYLVTDARDPLGPIQSIHVGGNNIFGFQTGVGLDVYKLLGVLPEEGTRWRLNLDYLSRRGPALGTQFDYQGKLGDVPPPDELPGRYEGMVRAYGIYDQAQDILGGERPPGTLTFDPPHGRGRVQWRQGIYELPYGFTVQSQLSVYSDRNFIEQYFKREFDTDPNQSTWLYVKQQQDNWAWAVLAEPKFRPWITETAWLPRADGYLLGQDLFDLFTSNTQVSLAYAQYSPSNDPPQPVIGGITTPEYLAQRDRYFTSVYTGRASVIQDLSMPINLGPLKVMPYLKGQLTQYSSDIDGDVTGRAWGGGGLRTSIPFTRLYPDACSELFNVAGINHKITLGSNYFYARTNEHFDRFAQLDRLNDEATDEAMRDLRPRQPLYYPGTVGQALATSPYYDPQTYAIRRLIDNRIDTVDDIQVLQVDLRQRLQTKRGYPGSEHIVDWMVLNTSFSYFPEPSQNFGQSFSFYEYQYLWNIGDRTSLESTGWYDPHDLGVRVFTVGLNFNRTDRTSFYLGYRQTDPLESRMMTGAVTYVFSPKYAMTASVSYDLGTSEALTNSLMVTRTGTDLQISLGFTYNSLQGNFGALVEVVPNLLPANRRYGAQSVGGQGGLLNR